MNTAVPKDDPMARTVAENQMGDAIFDADGGSSDDDGRARSIQAARTHLAAFPSVRFETVTAHDGGRLVGMRRLVVTGAWEVDPNVPIQSAD